MKMNRISKNLYLRITAEMGKKNPKQQTKPQMIHLRFLL